MYGRLCILFHVDIYTYVHTVYTRYSKGKGGKCACVCVCVFVYTHTLYVCTTLWITGMLRRNTLT
jgi:hypothetical protein